MKMLLWRALGVLLMLSALAVPLLRAPERSVESLVARWALPPSEFVQVAGQPVHLRDEGPRDDPAPLLLLHDMAGSLHDWDRLADGWRARHRVIRLDLPGHGLTGPLLAGDRGFPDYRPAAMARFVRQALVAMKVERITAIGHGWGGEVAWQLALQDPSPVRRLVLSGSGGYDLPAAQAVPGLVVATWPVVGPLGDYLMPRPLVEASLEAVFADPRYVTAARVDRSYEMLSRSGNRAALRLMLTQQQPGADEARISLIKVPTLLLWGEQDRQVPVDAAHRFANDVAGARLVLVPGAGHQLIEEATDSVQVAVDAFLELSSGP